MSMGRLAAGFLGQAGLVPGSVGRKAWCLGKRGSAWCLGPWWLTGAGLVLESALMGLGPGSVWADLDLGSTGANQVPRTSGWAHHLNLYGAYLVLGWTGSLISQELAWRLGPQGQPGTRASLESGAIGGILSPGASGASLEVVSVGPDWFWCGLQAWVHGS